jgi:hypothetical protein
MRLSILPSIRVLPEAVPLTTEAALLSGFFYSFFNILQLDAAAAFDAAVV